MRQPIVAHGAPELPDDMFYRVAPGGEGFRIEIRRRRRFRRSQRLSYAWVQYDGGDIPLSTVVQACHDAYAFLPVDVRELS